jgi:hypothetical protein
LTRYWKCIRKSETIVKVADCYSQLLDKVLKMKIKVYNCPSYWRSTYSSNYISSVANWKKCWPQNHKFRKNVCNIYLEGDQGAELF